MAETVSNGFDISRQMKITGVILAGIIGCLLAAYFLISRFNYDVLFQDLKPSVASLVVAELETREISFRLQNGGSDIYVPAKDVASAKLAIVGSEAPTKHLTGFELFNESEMGLTDFAQKIKYQRALQGELSRTLMMMAGIENARVHIAMPERALFRSSQGQPKAAVTIITENGRPLDNIRIIGIQSLVSSAVPELDMASVVVLDATGNIISPDDTFPIASNTLRIDQLASVAQNEVETRSIKEIEIVPTLKTVSEPVTETVISNPLPSIAAVTDIPSPKQVELEKYGLPAKLKTGHEDAPIVKTQAEPSLEQSPSPITQWQNLQWPNLWWLIVGGFFALLALVLTIRHLRHQDLSKQEHLNFAQELKDRLEIFERPFNVAA